MRVTYVCLINVRYVWNNWGLFTLNKSPYKENFLISARILKSYYPDTGFQMTEMKGKSYGVRINCIKKRRAERLTQPKYNTCWYTRQLLCFRCPIVHSIRNTSLTHDHRYFCTSSVMYSARCTINQKSCKKEMHLYHIPD
jgi:hypothetical protein